MQRVITFVLIAIIQLGILHNSFPPPPLSVQIDHELQAGWCALVFFFEISENSEPPRATDS